MSNICLDSPLVILGLDRFTTQSNLITTVTNQTRIHQTGRITRSRTYCRADDLVFGITTIVVDITPQTIT